jgi:hypothetical protein
MSPDLVSPLFVVQALPDEHRVYGMTVFNVLIRDATVGIGLAAAMTSPDFSCSFLLCGNILHNPQTNIANKIKTGQMSGIPGRLRKGYVAAVIGSPP